MRAAIYARISDDREGTGLGVTRQLEDCRDLAEGEGWTVVAELTDGSASAYSGKVRPGYARLCQLIEAREVDVVIAWANDRLHRRPVELESFIDLLERTGATVTTVTSGKYDLGTPEGRAMARIGGAIAASESERKSVRNRRKALELARAGAPVPGGPRKYGWEPDAVTVRPDEAANIREAAQRLLAGEPVRSILRDWDERGIRSSTGKPWRHGSFVRTMMRWRNAAVREHYGEPVAQGQWEPILDRETTERLRALLSDPSRRPKRAPASYMLRGLAVCGRCEALLIAKPREGGRRSYACARGPGLAGCGGISALADPLEAEVVGRVAAALAGDGLAAALEQLDQADEGDESASELVRLRDRLEELSTDYYEMNRLSRSEYLSRRDGLERRIEAAEAMVSRQSGAGMLAQLPTTEAAIIAEFEARDVAWCRTMLGAILERVVLHPSKPGPRFDPDRVECVWKV